MTVVEQSHKTKQFIPFCKVHVGFGATDEKTVGVLGGGGNLEKN